MNCCQTQELLSAYLDRQLTGQEMLAIEAHLGRCDECAEELSELRQVKYLLRSLGDRQASPEFGAAISSRLQQNRPDAVTMPVRFIRPLHGRPLAAAVALSCLAVFAAASPFSPAVLEGARIESGEHILSLDWPPRDAATPMFSAPSRVLSMTAFSRAVPPAASSDDSDSRYARRYAQPPAAGLDGDPLDEPAVNGYAQGDVTLVSVPAR